MTGTNPVGVTPHTPAELLGLARLALDLDLPTSRGWALGLVREALDAMAVSA